MAQQLSHFIPGTEKKETLFLTKRNLSECVVLSEM